MSVTDLIPIALNLYEVAISNVFDIVSATPSAYSSFIDERNLA